jgi:Fe-S-cluster containining protein
MDFNCSKCGACCLKVTDELPAKPNGSCLYLIDIGSQKLCSIYEVRPDICRSNYSRRRSEYENLSDYDFNRLLESACQILKNHFGVN